MTNTNWFSLFYWISVADGIKTVFLAMAIIFTIILAISTIGYFVSSGSLAEELACYGDENNKDVKSWNVWVKAWRTVFLTCFIVSLISTIITVFIPSKKDALIIIAGGVVGNFITQDTTSRKIPHEIMDLLSEKIKAEIKDTKLSLIPEEMKDTLKNKSKEQLIQMLKDQNNKSN